MTAYSDMDEIFRALADPSRRLLLDSLNDRNGQTLRELGSGLEMARQSVSKHLAVLEAANLVTTVRRGREKHHYLNAAPINEIAERWITRYDQDRVHALADLKRALEDTPMDKPSFVYTTYIQTTPERLWQALTEPAFTERYWATTFDSDWKPGSKMTWHTRGLAIADPAQVVVESEPYRRLAYTWHTFTPEWAASLDLTDEARDRLAGESRSKVTFEIEPLGEQVKLTVIHDDLDPAGLTGSLISQGWPRVLANLKTLLETGETLPDLQQNTPARLGLTAPTHTTASREQWLAERLDLLDAEKDLTRRSDDVARRRRELPWVAVEKDYRFETEAGPASLVDLFGGGRSQLLVYHFMFGPDYTGGCPSCSAIADGFNGIAVHLENHDVGMIAVSRAPIAGLAAYKRRMGWTFPWASSLDSDFNFDFNTSLTEDQQRSGTVDYNYRPTDTTWLRDASDDGVAAQHAAMTGTDVATYLREQPGMSAFALEDGVAYHTYSAYARGLDGLWGMYQWLDRAPKGRNETGAWFRRRDEY